VWHGCATMFVAVDIIVLASSGRQVRRWGVASPDEARLQKMMLSTSHACMPLTQQQVLFSWVNCPGQQ
jgi:hypothetical protein